MPNPAKNGSISRLGRALTGALAAAALTIMPASAAPAEQTVLVDVAPPRVQVYPLGTARVQTVLTNPSGSEQVFALEILLVRGDGTIVAAQLTEALALAPGATAPAIYTVRHADGAVDAVITPRAWPELGL